MDDKTLNAWNTIMAINKEETGKTKEKKENFNCTLGDSFANIYFTKRESESMLLFLKGKTMKEAAKIIGISTRTVEAYLGNMKKKLGCRTKSQLIEIVLQSEFLDNKCISKLLKNENKHT